MSGLYTTALIALVGSEALEGTPATSLIAP